MNIHKKIGSKDRLFEMFENVNKIKLNEWYDDDYYEKPSYTKGIGDFNNIEWKELHNSLKRNEAKKNIPSEIVSVNDLIDYDGMLSPEELEGLKHFGLIEIINKSTPIIGQNEYIDYDTFINKAKETWGKDWTEEAPDPETKVFNAMQGGVSESNESFDKTLSVKDWNEFSDGSIELTFSDNRIESFNYWDDEDTGGALDYHASGNGDDNMGILLYMNDDNTLMAKFEATSLTNNPDNPEWEITNILEVEPFSNVNEADYHQREDMESEPDKNAVYRLKDDFYKKLQVDYVSKANNRENVNNEWKFIERRPSNFGSYSYHWTNVGNPDVQWMFGKQYIEKINNNDSVNELDLPNSSIKQGVEFPIQTMGDANFPHDQALPSPDVSDASIRVSPSKWKALFNQKWGEEGSLVFDGTWWKVVGNEEFVNWKEESTANKAAWLDNERSQDRHTMMDGHDPQTQGVVKEDNYGLDNQKFVKSPDEPEKPDYLPFDTEYYDGYWIFPTDNPWMKKFGDKFEYVSNDYTGESDEAGSANSIEDAKEQINSTNFKKGKSYHTNGLRGEEPKNRKERRSAGIGGDFSKDIRNKLTNETSYADLAKTTGVDNPEVDAIKFKYQPNGIYVPIGYEDKKIGLMTVGQPIGSGNYAVGVFMLDDNGDIDADEPIVTKKTWQEAKNALHASIT